MYKGNLIKICDFKDNLKKVPCFENNKDVKNEILIIRSDSVLEYQCG